jgi:hypothetical protein
MREKATATTLYAEHRAAGSPMFAAPQLSYPRSDPLSNLASLTAVQWAGRPLL